MRSAGVGFKLSSIARLQLHSSAQMKAQTRVILLAERRWEARLSCLHTVCQTQVSCFLWLDWFSVCYIVAVSSSLLSLDQPLLSCFLLCCCCSKKKKRKESVPLYVWIYFAVVCCALYYLVHQVFLLHWSARDFLLEQKQPLRLPHKNVSVPHPHKYFFSVVERILEFGMYKCAAWSHNTVEAPFLSFFQF